MAKSTTVKPKMPVVQASFTETEKKQLEQNAKSLGLSVSSFVRTVINKYADGYVRSQKAIDKK